MHLPYDANDMIQLCGNDRDMARGKWEGTLIHGTTNLGKENIADASDDASNHDHVGIEDAHDNSEGFAD
jgi:hypothetical protein